MTEDQNLGLIWGVGALVLVVSALFGRQLKFGHVLRMSLAWVAIFAVIFVAFSFRSEFAAVWQRVKSELTGEPEQNIAGNTLRVRKSSDGHFWLSARINDESQRFLIDSGATMTTMSQTSAKKAGLVADNGFPVILSTANGEITARRGLIDRFSVGGLLISDHNILITEVEDDDTNVIGMNFLSQLASWRVEGDEMVLEPKQRQ